jgi:aspartyl-tRNA(Asn)/glutamyl-tRNA(Gln) amidotransferase subunit C
MAVDVSPERVLTTAELARLALRDDEVAPLAAQLQSILAHIAALDAYDTVGVPPTAHVLDLAMPLRDDVPARGVDRATVLSQAASSEQGAFVVPRFVAE